MRNFVRANSRLKQLLGLTLGLTVLGCHEAAAAPQNFVHQKPAAKAETLQASKSSALTKTGAATTSTSVSGWMLDQRSRVMGDQTVHVSPIGIKVVNRKDGLTFVTAAPFTEIFSYSLKTRKFCHQTSDKSENPYARAVAMFSGIAHGQMTMKKDHSYTKGGVKWSHFAIPEEYKKARTALYQKHEISASEPATGRMVGFHMEMDKRGLDWLSRLLCVPKTGTIPFDVVFVDVDTESHSLLKTFRMLPAKVSAADFKCPPGLHSVRDPRSVIQDETANDAIEMMMSGSDRDAEVRRRK